MKTKIRTVGLTPIKNEVDSYVNWLWSEGFVVLSVEWPKSAGYDVMIRFVVKCA